MRRYSESQLQEIEEIKAVVANRRTHEPKAHLTPEMRRRALKLVDQGLPAAAVARAIGLSKSSIYAWQHTRAKSSSPVSSTRPKPSKSRTTVLPTSSDVANPRVFAVTHDTHAEAQQHGMQGEQARAKQPPPLRLQIGGFDITVAWQGGAL